MLKILIISHAMSQEVLQTRWKRLAEKHDDINVRILAPRKWISEWFKSKEPQVFKPKIVQHKNFQVFPVHTTDKRKWTTYLIRGLGRHLKNYDPDIIFCVHEESIRVLHQVIFYKSIFCRKAKLIYFSMSLFPRTYRMKKKSIKETTKKLISYLKWKNVCAGTDAACVHYPAIEEQMKREGYSKPVLIQSQMGVDCRIFRFNQEIREKIRNKTSLNEFVIGYSGRLVEIKGILDLLKALETIHASWQLLLVGDGELNTYIKKWALKHNVSDRVVITGYVSMNEVAKYMNAMDCFYIGSRTVNHWVDTFPLVVAQAMACRLPILVSNSGSLPYQVGDRGLIFSEGDVDEIASILSELIRNQNYRKNNSQDMLVRAKNKFCIEAMNEEYIYFIKTTLKRL